MKVEDYFNRKLIEEFTIKPEIKALSRSERLDLLNQLFKNEYQGKVVSFKMLEKELFVKTTAVTRSHFGIVPRNGSFKGFMTKLNISAGGDYLPLISNSEYVRSADEKKSKQNSFHRNTRRWHYFEKEILCEGEKFKINIDVRESKKQEYIVYNVGMRPVQKNRQVDNELHKKRREPTNSALKAAEIGGVSAPAGISSVDIISQEDNFVKRDNKKSLISLIADAVSRKNSTKQLTKKNVEKER